MCGLGQYELSIDGMQVGTNLLTPGWTRHDKTCLYDTRDVTGMLHMGKNAVGIILGPGMHDMTKHDRGKVRPTRFSTLFAWARSTKYVIDYGFGDWMDIGPGNLGVSQLTPVSLTATAFYYQDVKIISQMADLLGQRDDTVYFHKLSDNIRKTFNARFF